MSYQVLARKWRPRSFREMVGQTHVLKALISALDNQRLHHAYLFTGTRGVGKTTIARIMAKCLNCEQGISSTPCGQCSICKEIDEGRFVDLIEVDAASKTKVEDTRELLDNVQYMPSRGRYKVYLIDEVHMLSTSSFNALLKTLEEPPPYIKFLLATTDPQKLPPTVLSRCLQFSLKNMQPEAVVGHLNHVLSAEHIPFEEDALWLLGRAADGSMRDAMSLTDQAVAFGDGKVLAEDVRAMLGTLDHGQIFGVLDSLIQGDGRGLLSAIAQLAEQGPDWMGVLADVINVLHRIAIGQLLPEAVDNGEGDREQILALAQQMPAEDVQFYYQMALVGRRDLPLAPDARSGFEMVMLRLLAFRPAGLAGGPSTQLQTAKVDAPKTSLSATASIESTLEVLPEKKPESETQDLPPWEEQIDAESVASNAVSTHTKEPEPEPEPEPEANAVQQSVSLALEEAVDDNAEDEEIDLSAYSYLADMQADEYFESETKIDSQDVDLQPDIPVATGLALQWIELQPALGLTGLTANIANNCTLMEQNEAQWLLHLDPTQSALFNETQRKRLNEAVNNQLNQTVVLQVEIQTPAYETPALAAKRFKAQRQHDAEQEIQNDPNVKHMMNVFGATIIANSIQPIDSDPA